MNCILCVDNSGSTSGSLTYWKKVAQICEELKPYKLIYWNTTAKVMHNFVQHSEGCTEPGSFIELLAEETAPYNLIVTTDGEIHDSGIETCSWRVTPQLLAFINSTVIYYIGIERSMNIGLNVIFGRTKKISYHINDQSYGNLIEKFDALELDDFMSPNFAISLIVKIKNIEVSQPDQTTRETKIAELRGEICRFYSKLERETLDISLDQQLEIYFQNNQMHEFINVLTKDRLDVAAVSRQKSAVLNILDRKIDFNISRISAATAIREQVIEGNPDEESAWSEFEDVITLDKFNLPCLLVQNSNLPVIEDKIILKHPFLLLSEPEIIKKIMLLIEPNPIDYTTYQKLTFDSRGYTVSPYTRASCKGVFVLEATNAKCVKNNCRAMSTLFGKQNKVPGSLYLWNLIITYLIYKHKLNDTEYKDVIFDQIISYCKKFTTSLSFTHQCQVLRPARIEVCLWYCIHAAPTACPNTARNVLRSPFGLELLQFYLDTFGRDCTEYLEKLSHRTRKWAVWNYLLVKRAAPNLAFEVRAQYQNYCIYKDTIILLVGKCEEPFKSKCNIIDAESVNTLYANLTKDSSKIADIDQFEPVPVNIEWEDFEGVEESITHVKINIKTCWPYVICPIAKAHWRECVGEYDVKTESHVRLFNTYCCKYKMYPSNHMDLALLYSKRTINVLKSRDLSNFEYVYGLFHDVMETYNCDRYISIYNSHADEKLRLAKE